MTREEATKILKEERWYMSRYSEEYKEAYDMATEALSADTVSRYAEWLEKIIVDNEGANDWLCEDTPDMEWCEKNCHYSSLQAECLRHLYEVSKGGEDE